MIEDNPLIITEEFA